MNREDIIRMAHESHLDVYGLGKDYAKFADALERFAALVASAEREVSVNALRTLNETYEIELRKAIATEREACADTVDKVATERNASKEQRLALHVAADAIRARGQA